jgi:uncharacterized membrane protein
MLKYFIQVIQNLLTTAILIALLSALVDKANRGKRLFFAFCCGGSGAALILAVLRRTTRLINREFVNTGVLAAAFVCAVLFIALAFAFGKKQALREKALEWVQSVLTALLLFYALPVVLLYLPEFFPPGQSAFSTEVLYKVIGFLAGVLVTVLSGLALFEAARRLSVFTVKVWLSAALAVTMVSHLSVIVQFLLGRRLISVPRRVFKLMVWIINHYDIFLYSVMVLSAAVPLFLWFKSFQPLPATPNPAQARKMRARKRTDRRWIAVALCGYAVAVLSLTVLKGYNERGVELTPAEPINIVGDEIVIPIEKVADGHLHRYNYAAGDGIEMRFIVIKKNEVAYGVGLDACDICGPTGYYERKDQVICRLCDVVMNISTIGFKGGCNPVPLTYTLRSGNMVIAMEDLEKERSRFK